MPGTSKTCGSSSGRGTVARGLATGLAGTVDGGVEGETGTVVTAGSGDDQIIGGAGDDTLVGGAGDDTYTVNSADDVVTELADEGTDRVRP